MPRVTISPVAPLCSVLQGAVSTEGLWGQKCCFATSSMLTYRDECCRCGGFWLDLSLLCFWELLSSLTGGGGQCFWNGTWTFSSQGGGALSLACTFSEGKRGEGEDHENTEQHCGVTSMFYFCLGDSPVFALQP